MSFLAITMPDDVAYGFVAGDMYDVDIVRTLGGWEQRNLNAAQSLGRWTAAYPNKTKAQSDGLLAFWHVANGRQHGFLAKDWMDFEAAGSEGVLTLVSTDLYQMYKRFTSQAQTKDREIKKPRSGTIAIAGGGTYTIDYATGRVTRVSGAAPTGWTGQFDKPCRFDMEKPNISAVARSGADLIYSWGDAAIVEIRV